VHSKLEEPTVREAVRPAVMKLYQLLLVDPPWQELAWSEAGMGRAAENRYRTKALDRMKEKIKPPAGGGIWVGTVKTMRDRAAKAPGKSLFIPTRLDD